MSEKNRGEAPASPWLSMLLCWLAYTSAYLGRYSYHSNITAVMGRYGVTHAEAGLVTTCFFFAYGAGQIVHGLLCRRYSLRWAVPLALAASSLLNLAVFLDIPFAWLKYLWIVNGACQSVLWPTLISILSRCLPGKQLKRSVIVMSTTVPVGTVAAYGISALLAVSGSYRVSFLAGTVVMMAAAGVWLALCGKAFSAPAGETGASTELPAQKGISRSVRGTVMVLGLFAVANNLVKDGLTTWVPSILKESFALPESLSILLTLTLPVLGLFGAACNTLLEKRIHSFIAMSGVWYLLTAVCIGAVLFFTEAGAWGAVLLAFGLVSLFMHGVNNVITSMAPLYLREQANSGLLAGLLNGCCYVGSTISSYGLGFVADHSGWNGVFLLLLAVSVFPVLLAALSGLRRRAAS